MTFEQKQIERVRLQQIQEMRSRRSRSVRGETPLPAIDRATAQPATITKQPIPALYFASRSAAQTYQRCPRKRFWMYLWQDRGISPKRLSLELVNGIYVHQALADLLAICHEAESAGFQPYPNRDHVRALILEAKQELHAFCKNRGFRLKDESEDEYEVYLEQAALLEGMIWCYYFRHLPTLLETYEILETEKEDAFNLTKYLLDQPLAEIQVVWQGRADGLLRQRATGSLHVLSFKTTSKWDVRKERTGLHDMQGLSESYAIEKRLDGQFIDGVKMEYLLRGERKKNYVGQYEMYSPLIRGWVDARDDIPGFDGPQYFWRYEWENVEGRKKRLGRNQRPYYVWKDGGMGVEQWVELLVKNDTILPNQSAADPAYVPADDLNPLDDAIVSPVPYFRNDQDIQSWLSSMEAQETAIAVGYERFKCFRDQGDLARAQNILDAYFPMFHHSCDYPNKCEFQGVCFGSEQAVNVDPIANHEFQWRDPHHEPELIHIRELGE